MKFKELKKWDRFEFSNGRGGPWIKLSARTYTKDTSPFADDRAARLAHQFWCREYNSVQSINVDVDVDVEIYGDKQ
jgi:hypothetical protein